MQTLERIRESMPRDYWKEECNMSVTYTLDFTCEDMMNYIKNLNAKRYVIDKRFGVYRKYRVHRDK